MTLFNKVLRQQKILWVTLLVLVCVSIICQSFPQITDVNWQTILSLFSLMLVTQYLIKIKALDYLSQKIIDLAYNERQVTQLLVLLAAVLAMFLTNDVAILSLIPLFLVVHKQIHGSFVWPLSLITISANLGSALTPFGNPQNLYLYNHFKLSIGNFLNLSFPLTATSFVLLAVATWMVPKTPLSPKSEIKYTLKPLQLFAALSLLGLTLLGVLHFIPLVYTSVAVLLVILILDHSIITRVDYGTLLTFISFFLIVGILGRNLQIINLITLFLKKGAKTTYWTGIILSQIISNVPATFLIAKFSTNIAAIFLGVNVGGLGTPIASFANLLALKQAHVHNWQILGGFLGVNFVFLIILALIILLFIP